MTTCLQTPPDRPYQIVEDACIAATETDVYLDEDSPTSEIVRMARFKIQSFVEFASVEQLTTPNATKTAVLLQAMRMNALSYFVTKRYKTALEKLQAAANLVSTELELNQHCNFQMQFFLVRLNTAITMTALKDFQNAHAVFENVEKNAFIVNAHAKGLHKIIQ
jgi:UDP-3-O-[3-hydroxymyristoyl] glucosamine N-acyltransferase